MNWYPQILLFTFTRKKNQIHTTGMYFCNLSTSYADRFAKLDLQNNSLEKEVLIRIASDTNQAVNHNK